MKKYCLLLVGSGVLFFSCGTSSKPSNQDVIIDSAVRAKLNAHDAENNRRNDSIITAEARIKAEAMEAEQKSGKQAKSAVPPPSKAVPSPVTDSGTSN